MSIPQKRLPKFTRQPTGVKQKRLTSRSLDIIFAIARYRFLPTSMLVRLIEGNEDVTHRHLQQLFHKGLINRFAFARVGGSNEFNYYLDNTRALELLVEHGRSKEEELNFAEVRTKKQKGYHKIHESAEDVGRALFLKHELMISRFHFALEMSCRDSAGTAQLTTWKQGPELYSTVSDSETGEDLPHEPDAFFTLCFPEATDGESHSNFFYEADRGRTGIKRMLRKFRAHYEFIKQKHHQNAYGVRRIRAVLIETLNTTKAEQLRRPAMRICPVPLFWFTASEIFLSKEPEATERGSAALRLIYPEFILKKIWATTHSDSPLMLAD